jgi:uncharacterized protein
LSDPAIIREVTGNRGRYAVETGGGIAELTYSVASPSRIVANHTFVPVPVRGTGIAAALVERLVVDARAEGVRIVPRCSFVEAERRRHPEWADVFTT